MSGDEEVIYCICRSSDVSRFMIGCDHCEEWFHGDCIQITAKDSKYIKKFFCKECREKNPHLKVVYKSKYADKHQGGDSQKEEKRAKEKKKSKDKDRERSRSKERHKHKDKKHKKDKDRGKDEKKDRDKSKDVLKEESKSKDKKETKAKPIISSSEDEREKTEEARRKELEKEKEKEREKMKQLEKERQKLREEKRKEKELEEKKRKEAKEKERKERSSTDIKNKSSETAEPRKPLQTKDIDNINKYDSEDEWRPKPATTAAAGSTSSKAKQRKPLKETSAINRKRAWRPDYDTTDDEEQYDLRPRQCHGMECVKSARVGSKYCSDQCGLDVASVRIYQTLPERIREWNMTRCQAEQKNRKELERIREDIQSTKQRLEEVDKEAEQLENTIARGKTMSIIEHKSEDSSDEEDELKASGAVNCISCGKDVPSRTAIRHMESCFNKFESQTSFGSMYKTKIEGYQMFCDFYNPQTETYCKRLRVICPEHTKDHKLLETEVCGFPLTKDVFKESGEFCRLSRKECNEHHCWEKLKRAELDMDRVRQWLKLDELLEKERQEKEAMSRRAGVLNLMLHSTFNHELAIILQKKNRPNPSNPPKQKQPRT